MAPKVCVPADFGRHHIGAPSHGNLTFNLGEGVKIRANSIILSLNSPVIDELTTNLHQTSLEADDFSREAVDCFVESTYTGEIEAVNLGNFRDVNKMSRVFQVSWLVAKCEEYFVSYLDKLDSESSYSDMLFVVEEAVYLMSAIKSRDFLNLTVKKIASISVTSRDSFVTKYISDFGQASIHMISACIALVQSDVHVLVELLIKHLKQSGNESLDESSRHLLKNLDMTICFDKKPEVHEELFTELENLAEVTREDSRLFLSMYKQLSCKKPAQSNTLFTAIKLRSFKNFMDRSLRIDNVLSKLSVREDIPDLYSFIDGLWLRLFCIKENNAQVIKSSFVEKISNVARQHGWSPTCSVYVKELYNDNGATEEFVKTIQTCDGLVRDRGNSPYVTIFEYSPQRFIEELFCKDNIFKFQIPGDLFSKKEFVLFTTGVKGDNFNSFDLRWGMRNDGLSSTAPDLPKLHFALAAIFKFGGGSLNRVLPISWCGKPTCDESRTYWNWGYIKFHGENRNKIREMVGHSDGCVDWPFYYGVSRSAMIKMVAFIC